MSQQTEITITFSVKLKLPKGGNASSAQAYIRGAIEAYQGGGESSESPYFNLKAEDFTVRLIKREINYVVTRR